ncbi:MAG: PhoH family protein [Akkermansiaceae bacterium]|jgi:PhoH-like ATPase|nr:PhoH family protein [Akkermansiaceae bacterium]MDP4645535.1 PhoH family protein [Akkermansiaceae bacterium]MDP4721884.1 PhoH family protein [Akkermansiaceae bacterium]MDP4778657.1 PhoH family protein [Akkermansiaceae bacterium]MDP4847798.1 PhoH family protein [Akkermansiaceae bacterium]
MNPSTQSMQPALFEESPVAAPPKRSRRSSATRAIEEFGLKAPTKLGKNYVLDTNVLLHDPACLERFKENHICILVDVLAELDKFKSEQSERGANARRVHRRLTDIFAASTAVTGGVPTEGGGTIRLVIYDPSSCPDNSDQLKQFYRIFPDRERVDHRILAACVLVQQHNPDSQVALVTKDINLQLKARAVSIECQDYLNDKVDAREVSNYDVRRIEVDATELHGFASKGEIAIPQDRREGISVNEYVLLSCGEKQTIPARLQANGLFVRLNIPEVLKIPDGQSLKPLNLGQRCLIDALLNPDISLVTCYGHAGTGKTLVAVAAGLHEMFNRKYNGITVSRPVVSMGDQLGFLPGSLDEKMRPWLQPIHDALDLLMRPNIPLGPKRKQVKPNSGVPPKKPYEMLMEQGILEIEALCYIRGRSIPNRFFILDEAQQLTPQEAKTIVTRMSRDSKLVLVGDPAQIDNPYVDSRSNGLVYTRNRLKDQPFSAHVALNRGERSELAEAGAQLM